MKIKSALLPLITAVFVCPYLKAHAQGCASSAGAKNATSFSTLSYSGSSFTWTSPGNAQTSDGNYAAAGKTLGLLTSQYSGYLTIQNFGFFHTFFRHHLRDTRGGRTQRIRAGHPRRQCKGQVRNAPEERIALRQRSGLRGSLARVRWHCHLWRRSAGRHLGNWLAAFGYQQPGFWSSHFRTIERDCRLVHERQ